MMRVHLINMKLKPQDMMVQAQNIREVIAMQRLESHQKIT